MTEQEADGLRDRIGGRAHHTGGGLWVVIAPMADGKALVVSDELLAIYESERAFLDGHPTIYEAING